MKKFVTIMALFCSAAAFASHPFYDDAKADRVRLQKFQTKTFNFFPCETPQKLEVVEGCKDWSELKSLRTNVRAFYVGTKQMTIVFDRKTGDALGWETYSQTHVARTIPVITNYMRQRAAIIEASGLSKKALNELMKGEYTDDFIGKEVFHAGNQLTPYEMQQRLEEIAAYFDKITVEDLAADLTRVNQSTPKGKAAWALAKQSVQLLDVMYTEDAFTPQTTDADRRFEKGNIDVVVKATRAVPVEVACKQLRPDLHKEGTKEVGRVVHKANLVPGVNVAPVPMSIHTVYDFRSANDPTFKFVCEIR